MRLDTWRAFAWMCAAGMILGAVCAVIGWLT